MNSGHFPQTWTNGIIVPILKKGDVNNTDNYRGITLLSCLGKLFTQVLNDRIRKWAMENDISTDAQFGFKKGHSTVDAIYILHTLISKQLSHGKKLYCTFVDFKKAFDHVYLQGLWYKLVKSGFSGKIFKVIMSMYSDVKSCIRHNNLYSNFFKCSIGLRQGEVLSPILFSLFLNDIELKFQANIDAGISLEDLNLYTLLFADDMVLFSETIEGLQKSLHMLYEYCSEWNIEVNIEKTKCMVFRKCKRLTGKEEWFFGNKCLENTDTFTYLGTLFNYNGLFTKNTQYLAGKGVKAMHSLFSLLKDKYLSLSVICNLFDTCVSPILSYGSEVWSFHKGLELERIHKKFMKRILNLNITANDAAVYGELGRFSLITERYVKIVKYWFKLVNTNNCILSACYKYLLDDCIRNNSINWVSLVRETLCKYGFMDVWLSPQNINVTHFTSIFGERIRDTFISEWRTNLTSSSKLWLYKEIKQYQYVYEDYLDKILNIKHRQALTKLRCSSHNLFIEMYRHGPCRKEKKDRICLSCNIKDIEDEYHFLLICPAYQIIRQKLIKSYYWKKPSVYKCILLLTSNSVKEIRKVAKFVYDAFQIRQQTVYNV